MTIWIVVQDGIYIGSFYLRQTAIDFLKNKNPYLEMEDHGSWVRFSPELKYKIFRDSPA